jgi:hypothetical protein
MAGTRRAAVRLHAATKVARSDEVMSVDQCYRRYASECITLAQRTSDAHDRAILDRMAAAWIQLAEKAGIGAGDPEQTAPSPPEAKQPQQ